MVRYWLIFAAQMVLIDRYMHLLMDKLVKRLLRANIALEQGDMPLFQSSVQRCIDIVRYLDDTLNRRYEVSRNLHRLYDFFC